MKRYTLLLTGFFLIFFAAHSTVLAQSGSGLLSPDEALWLKTRNNTIVVYPIENAPPYSYKNAAGNPEGLAIDYLKLVAEKVGAKLQFLTPRPLSQVKNDVENGKGDVISNIVPDDQGSARLIFTENYVTSPSVIVVRKDYGKSSGLNLNDFNGKRVAVVESSALESYVRVNYSRVVVEEVTDNEVALQQVVLGEVDGAAMDVASLSYYLSKQVLSSVKVAGNTGFESKPAFGMSNNQTTLQSILEKGLSQVSTEDRGALNDKWIALPNEIPQDNSFFGKIAQHISLVTLYVLLGLSVIVVLFVRRHHFAKYYSFRQRHAVTDLKEELSGLEKSHEMVAEELEAIEAQEKKLEKKIDLLDR